MDFQNVEITENEIEKLKQIKTIHASKYHMDIRIPMYKVVKYYDPRVIVELGTGRGIITLVMAHALKLLNGGGKIYTYDSYKDKIWTNSLKEQIEVFSGYGFSDIINAKEMNAWNWFDNPFDFDMMYIDIMIGNESLDKIFDFPFMKEKIKEKKLILYEGGYRLERNQDYHLNANRVGISMLRNI